MTVVAHAVQLRLPSPQSGPDEPAIDTRPVPSHALHIVTKSYTKPVALTSSDYRPLIHFLRLILAVSADHRRRKERLWGTQIGRLRPRYHAFGDMRER